MPLPLTNFRLTPHELRCMDTLGSALGLSRAGVLRLAVRALARREGIALPDEDLGNGKKTSAKKKKKT